MRIKTLTIKNFRSFDENGVSVSFPEIDVPISIVGHNNSGKSNLISAILYTCGFREYGYKYSIDDFYCHKTDTDAEVTLTFSEPIKIPTIYGANKDKECLGAQLSLRADGDEIIGFSYALDYDNKQIRAQEQLRARSLPLLINKYKDYINLFYIDFRDLDKYLKINSYSLLGKVLEDIKSDFKLPENTVKDKAGKDVPREEYFKKLLVFIENQLLKTKKFEELLKSIETTVKKQLQLEDDSIAISFKLPDCDEIYDSMSFKLSDNTSNKPPIPLSRLGDGFRAMLIIAILRVLINTGEGGKIIVLEEPESFLHEHFQEYFCGVLSELAKNNQVIYTTHSKKFVNIFRPESVIRVKNEEYLKSEIVYKEDPKVVYSKEIDGFSITNPDDFSKYLRTLEPNLGNIIFSNKVIIVEGPLDILAYKIVLQQVVNFNLNNIAIVAAWGKDPITTIIQLCQRFEIPFFVIHDWDLNDKTIDISVEPTETNSQYTSLDKEAKAQYTKNYKIFTLTDETSIHQNKRNLEDVLGLSHSEKTSAKVFEKVKGKSLEDIQRDFPGLINDKLLSFLQVKATS